MDDQKTNISPVHGGTLPHDLFQRKQERGDFNALVIAEHYDSQNRRDTNRDWKQFAQAYHERATLAAGLETRFADSHVLSWSWASVLTRVEYYQELN